MSDSSSNSTPQFSTVEYAKPQSDRCQFCQQPIGANYYRVNGALACPSCAEKMRGESAVDHAAFVRALTFGIAAAVVGLIGYALVAILLQGWVISYMSIGVGWIVGTAMMKGSNGVGGKRYQIVAALLTYAAVSMAAIPIWIHYAGEHRQHASQQQPLADLDSFCPPGDHSVSRDGPAWTLDISGIGFPVHGAFGKPLLGCDGPSDSLFRHEDRVENDGRPGTRCLRTVCLCAASLILFHPEWSAVRNTIL